MLETRQADEAHKNPDFYVYVVENVLLHDSLAGRGLRQLSHRPQRLKVVILAGTLAHNWAPTNSHGAPLVLYDSHGMTLIDYSPEDLGS